MAQDLAFGIPTHPFADLFPMLSAADADALRLDIASNGLRERIVILDGQILDGRNRYRAAVGAGQLLGDLPPEGDDLWISHFRRFNPAQDGDPLAWVLSKNLHRRHLSESQRAMVAAGIARLGRGRPKDLGDKPANLPVLPTQPEAARMLHVSERSVRSATKVRDHGAPELVERVRAGDVAISAAADIASLPITQQLAILQERDPRTFRRAVRSLKADRPRDERAVMNARVLPPDDLDYAPTPPWATRALLRHVLPRLGVALAGMVVREPGCGEGHISAVLHDEAGALQVLASDIHDYSVDGIAPAGWIGVRDFLDAAETFGGTDWTVMNPPFEDRAEAFVQRALAESAVGVAAFVRMGWLSSVGRYDRLFSITPPTLISFFAERVPLHMGRWDPEGSTATDYVWLVWVKDRAPMAPYWIPPGRRAALTLPDDVVRFTAHRVPPLATVQGETHAASEAIAMSFAEAKPILEAHYATSSGEALAARIGRPIGTIRTWAHRLGLTSRARLASNADHLGAHLNRGKETA